MLEDWEPEYILTFIEDQRLKFINFMVDLTPSHRTRIAYSLYHGRDQSKKISSNFCEDNIFHWKWSLILSVRSVLSYYNRQQSESC